MSKKETQAYVAIGGAKLTEELADAVRKWHPDPGENRPCKTCGKPTRSHWDTHEKTMQCHVCWMAEDKKKAAEAKEILP